MMGFGYRLYPSYAGSPFPGGRFDAGLLIFPDS